MREILFRGKTPTSREWVYGNYIETSEEYDKDDINYAIMSKENGHRCLGEYCDSGWEQVIPETVGQYTGLIDKNGNKIFEGDIVCLNKLLGVYIVKWDNEQCRFSMYADGIYEQAGFNKDTMPNYEIIGNIYDNKELLNADL